MQQAQISFGSSGLFLWFIRPMCTPMGYPQPVRWFDIEMWTTMGYPRPVTCTPKGQRTDKDNLCTPSCTRTLALLRTGAVGPGARLRVQTYIRLPRKLRIMQSVQFAQNTQHATFPKYSPGARKEGAEGPTRGLPNLIHNLCYRLSSRQFLPSGRS